MSRVYAGRHIASQEPRRRSDDRRPPASPGKSQARPSVLSALLWFGVSYGLAIVGYLAINSITSRWLGTAQFGYFVIAVTVSTGVGQFGLLGAHRAGLRDAAVMESGDQSALGQLRSSASATLAISMPVTSLAAGAVLYAQATGQPVLDRVVLALVFAALVYFSGLQKLWANYLRGMGEIRMASLLEGRSGGALVAVAQAILLVLVWQLLPSSTLSGALVATALGFALPILYVWLRVHRRWAHLPRPTHLWPVLKTSAVRNWKFAVNQMAVYVGGTVEIWLAGLVLTAHDTSLFSAAQRFALLLSVPLASMQVVFAPVTARLLRSGETKRLEKVLRTGATMGAVLSMVIWIPSLIAPRGVLSLVYGPGFTGAALALFLLSIGNAANVFSGVSGIVLTMSKNEGVAAGVQAVAVVLRIVIGVAAGLTWGLTGLAASSATMSMVMYLVMWWQAKSLLGVRTHATMRPSLHAIRTTQG